MDTLTREEFRELATTGTIRLSAERNEHDIVRGLTQERGWIGFPIFTMRQEPNGDDPGWTQIDADFERKRVIPTGNALVRS